jgi:uncharacterized protein
MGGPLAALLGDGSRLHLQHGPIDLVIGVDAATPGDRQRAFEAAARRFDTILSELVSELALLRGGVTSGSARPEGAVARRMHRAARCHARHLFVTPMAAVAGAVADEVLHAIVAHVPVSRAYVNNGGDIALHLGEGTQYRAAIAGLDGADHGRITIDAARDVRGIATSGTGGRSLSLGIADNVSVLGQTAAAADVAATLIANAVDLPGHGAITRQPARDITPDSDLGARLVVTHVGPLGGSEIGEALDAGAKSARSMLQQGLILGAALFLRGSQRIVGSLPQPRVTQTRLVKHA